MSNDVEDPEGGDAGTFLDASSPSPNHQPSWYSGLLEQASSIISKWAIMKFPYPRALTALQYFERAAGVFVCGWLKLIEHDKLSLLTMWRFLPAAIIFFLSAVPIFVAIGETLYLNQPRQAIKTWLSLGTIFAGSSVVGWWARRLTMNFNMSIDFVYIKHVVMTIGLNTWCLVLYNNLESLLPFHIELLILGELKKIKHEIEDESDWHSFQVVLPVALSCLFGLAISFFGFSCRRAICATGFTVLGIVNKLLKLVINLVIWDKHSKLIGTVGLLICMSGGVMYQQSTIADEEEQQKLLEMQSNTQSSDSEKQDTESGDRKQ
ncbi:unnamed protein product [Withania somnifera]